MRSEWARESVQFKLALTGMLLLLMIVSILLAIVVFRPSWLKPGANGAGAAQAHPNGLSLVDAAALDAALVAWTTALGGPREAQRILSASHESSRGQGPRKLEISEVSRDGGRSLEWRLAQRGETMPIREEL